MKKNKAKKKEKSDNRRLYFYSAIREDSVEDLSRDLSDEGRNHMMVGNILSRKKIKNKSLKASEKLDL